MIYEAGPSQEQYKYDYLAEMIYHYRDTEEYADALAWAAKAISRSKSTRYNEVLLHMKESEFRKVRKYADDALDDLPKVKEKNKATMVFYRQGEFNYPMNLVPANKIQVGSNMAMNQCHLVSSSSCTVRAGAGSDLCYEWHKLNAASKGANTASIHPSAPPMPNATPEQIAAVKIDATYLNCAGGPLPNQQPMPQGKLFNVLGKPLDPGTTSDAAHTPSDDPDSLFERLLEVEMLYKAGKIDKEQYNKLKEAIISSI